MCDQRHVSCSIVFRSLEQPKLVFPRSSQKTCDLLVYDITSQPLPSSPLLTILLAKIVEEPFDLHLTRVNPSPTHFHCHGRRTIATSQWSFEMRNFPGKPVISLVRWDGGCWWTFTELPITPVLSVSWSVQSKTSWLVGLTWIGRV